MDYIKLFESLPNFNFNKEIVQDDFYNPTLYKWDGYWVVSWISDEGDSLLDIVGNSPKEAIKNAVEYIKEHYQISIEEISQPFFTLTAEEVEKVKYLIESYDLPIVDWNVNELNEIEANLYIRIKQWQDENSTNKGTKSTTD